MSIISSIKTYLATYTGLESGAPIWVDYLGSVPVQYSIVPLPGSRIVEQYIDGSSLREFPFAFQTVKSTADNLERLESIGFQEEFADWLESQTAAGVLPTPGTKKTAESIEATGWGYLFEQGDSDTGIYQIQCKLVYRQQP
jgi:hypothetical protein